MAFTIGSSDLPGVQETLLESFEIKLLVNRRHPLSRKETVTIRDLEGEPLYLESSEFYIHHLIRNRCLEAGFTPNIVFETSGFSLCHKMVRENRGISVVVDFVFDDMGNDEMCLIPFSDGRIPLEHLHADPEGHGCRRGHPAVPEPYSELDGGH